MTNHGCLLLSCMVSVDKAPEDRESRKVSGWELHDGQCLLPLTIPGVSDRSAQKIWEQGPKQTRLTGVHSSIIFKSSKVGTSQA